MTQKQTLSDFPACIKITLLISILFLLSGICSCKKESVRASGEDVMIEISISGWAGNADEERVIRQMIDDYMMKNGNIVIKWTPLTGDFASSLKVKLLGGNAPDLFFVDINVFEELAKMNALEPLDTYIISEQFDIDDFYPSLTEAFQYEGNQMAIAKDFSTLGLWYNKKIFDDYRISYPTDEMTWDELAKIALELKEAGCEAPLVLSHELARVLPILYAYGGRFIDERLRIAVKNNNSRRALQFYFDLFRKDGTAFLPSTIGYGRVDDVLVAEKAAMGITGAWLTGYLKGVNSGVFDRMQAVQLPAGPGGKSTVIFTVAWGINRQAPFKKECWKLLTYLVTEGQQMFVEEAGVMASRRSIAREDRGMFKEVFYAGADYGLLWKFSTSTGNFSNANNMINARFRDVASGLLTVDEAIADITKNYNLWISPE